MSQAIGKFLQIFNECKNGIIIDLKTPKDIKVYLEKMINQLSIGLKGYDYQNNTLIIIHFLLNENDNNNIIEKVKKEILMKIVTDEKISVFSYASKIKFWLNEEIYDMRKKIIKIISEQIEYIKYEGNGINELYFFNAVKKIRDLIKNFTQEYKIIQF